MHNTEIGNKLTTVEMSTEALEMYHEGIEHSTEALEKYHEGIEHSTEALEKYHEGIEHSTEALEKYHEGVESSTEALGLTDEEQKAFEQLGAGLEESLFKTEAELNPDRANAPIESGSQGVCRSSQTPQNYCVFSGASRR